MISANATRRSTWIGSAILASLLAAPAAAQINYSFDFDANSTGWTGTFSRYTGTTTCSGTGGAMRRNIYTSGTSGSMISPLMGSAQGGTVDIAFDYKVCEWSANTVGAAAPWGTIDVQYGASATGPWTTFASFANEAQTGSCTSKLFSFNPPAGPLYVRWNCTWADGDNYWNFDNIVASETVSACSGTPAPGDTIAPANGVCPGADFSLSLQNATVGSGVSYQWYASNVSNMGPWSPVGTSAPTLIASQTGTSWYYCDVTCSGNTGTSNVVEVGMATIANPVDFANGLTSDCWAPSALVGSALPTFDAVSSAFGVGTGSFFFDFWSISASNEQAMTSPEFAPVAAGTQIYFDVAGRHFGVSVDHVILEESNDAGANWTTVVDMDNANATGVLSTNYGTGEIVPAAGDWQSLAYPLSAGTNRVRFRGVSAFGNNCYFDNVSVGVLPSARHTNYGPGCGMSMTASPAPISGTTFSYDLPNIPLACPAPDPVFHFGVVIASFDQDFAGTELTSLGLDSPGCKLHVASFDVLIAYVDVVPGQTVPLALPAGVPAGALLYSQAVALICPAAPNNAGLVLSNGVRSYINSF